MGLSSSQLDTLIESARAALQSALDSPKPNYTIGSKTVSFADYIKTLREQLDGLIAMQADIPSENIRDYDSDITDTGEDNTQYEGDENI
jgi:hypothetical protein